MAKLQGQVAIVTGASSGIGRAAALGLAAEGANVALVARRENLLKGVAAEIAARGGEALVCVADVTDAAAIDRAVKAAGDRFGRLDILVNDAGSNGPLRTFGDMTPESWEAVIEANLTSAFLCARAVLPTMRAQGTGTIISVASWAGVRPSGPSGPAYSAAKAALISLNDSINLENRQYGIRSSVVCPGEVATPILDLRPYPPSAAARATMLQPDDLAAAIMLVATLPPRATIELLIIRPTVLRDRSSDREAAEAASKAVKR